jgi:hypothetical protein
LGYKILPPASDVSKADQKARHRSLVVVVV